MIFLFANMNPNLTDGIPNDFENVLNIIKLLNFLIRLVTCGSKQIMKKFIKTLKT